MKILITGGCGFVGSNIAFYLKKKLKNAQIYSLDTLIRRGSESNKNRLEKIKIYNYKIDIADNYKLKKLKKFDLVIDCCAEPAIEESKKDPDRVFNTNLIGTFNILKKCLKDKSNLIFLSSSRVYSINNLKNLFKNANFKKPVKRKKIINENFPTYEASSLYGFTKLASEKLIKEFFFKTNQKYIINRFGVIAGPWQFGKQDQGFVTLWLVNHLFRKKLNYIGFWGLGNQVRDIIHIEDVCKIILIQIKNFKKINNDTFNIGGGVKNSISLIELTHICKKLTGNNIFLGKKPKTSIFDVPYYISDNRKILKTYNWKPLKSVDQILKDIYLWLINNKQVWKYFK